MELSDVGHIAIIMDGNGRWARTRRRARTFGHRQGVNAVRDTVTTCARGHLGHLTLYALSTENFRLRPAGEIRVLMALLRRFMVRERPTLMDNGVRLRTIGRVEDLPARVIDAVRETERLTARNEGMVLTLALNYGGRAEIADAVRRIAEGVKAGEIEPAHVDESLIAAHLYDPSLPDVDLMIRTGGDLRISNFLLWQVSYGELHVTPVLWPDFGAGHLDAAVEDYRIRARRFGGLLEGVDR